MSSHQSQGRNVDVKHAAVEEEKLPNQTIPTDLRPPPKIDYVDVEAVTELKNSIPQGQKMLRDIRTETRKQLALANEAEHHAYYHQEKLFDHFEMCMATTLPLVDDLIRAQLDIHDAGKKHDPNPVVVKREEDEDTN